jgi:uncharacterized protein (DUF1697 family)
MIAPTTEFSAWRGWRRRAIWPRWKFDVAIKFALFRGINVGKAKRIEMAELKAMFEDLGFSNVRTLLNSGNVVFEGGRTSVDADAKRIAAALTARIGVSANTLVLTATTLDAAIADNPFAERIDDPSRMLVGFHLDGRDRTPLDTLRRDHPDEAFALGAHACYLWCPDGILASRIGDALSGAKFRDHITARNWATTLKLQALAASKS